jgi:hypothetical protein
MKESLEKFTIIISDGKIDINDFYHASFTDRNIRFQGKADSDVLQKYKDAGWKFVLDDSATIIEGDMDNVSLIFTF